MGCTSKRIFELTNNHLTSRFEHACLASEQFLQKFTHLKRLEIDHTRAFSPTALLALTNLTYLKLSGEQYYFSTLTNLESVDFHTDQSNFLLSDFPKLTSLSSPYACDYPNTMKSVHFWYGAPPPSLAECTNLMSLSVQDTPPFLSNFPNLTYLCLRRKANIQKIVESCPQLRSLSLPAFDPALTQLRNLTSLSFFTLVDSSPLLQLPNLVELDLQSAAALDKHVLSKLTRLTSLLNLPRGIGGRDVPVSVQKLVSTMHEGPYSNLTNLTDLVLVAINGQPEDNHYSLLTNLTALDFPTSSLDGIKGLTKLTSLASTVVSSADLVQVIPYLPNLKSLKGREYNEIMFDY